MSGCMTKYDLYKCALCATVCTLSRSKFEFEQDLPSLYRPAR